jgi:acetolactate synthase I/III small subunit
MDAQRCVSKHERVYARLPTRYAAAPVLRDGRAQPRWKNVPARRAPSSGRGRSEIRSEDARVNTTHYPAAGVSQQIETHTLSVLVDNEPGVLARVIGLFSGRGYNIDSLTVSETEHEKHLSRITIVTRGTPMVIEQIKNQLDRLVPVHRVIDMTVAGPHIERELAMVKVRGKGEHRMEALRLADAFRARVIDASTESFVFEITGASEKIESFVALMIPLGLVEVSRTGIVAIGRGPEGM